MDVNDKFMAVVKEYLKDEETILFFGVVDARLGTLSSGYSVKIPEGLYNTIEDDAAEVLGYTREGTFKGEWGVWIVEYQIPLILLANYGF